MKKKKTGRKRRDEREEVKKIPTSENVMMMSMGK